MWGYRTRHHGGLKTFMGKKGCGGGPGQTAVAELFMAMLVAVGGALVIQFCLRCALT